MIIVNVNGNYFLKENDTATEIRLRIEDSQGNALDLSTAPRLEVVIGNDQGRILTKTPKLMSATGELEFGLDEGDVLPVGDNNLEVHIFTDAGERHVAPSKGYYRLRVQRAIDSTEVEITTYSLTYFIDEVNRITAGLPELVEQGNEISERLEQILEDSEGLVEETTLALAQSQESRDLAAQALVDAAQAGANAIAAEQAAVRANDAADRATPAAIRAEGAAEAAEQAKIDADAATAAANLATEAANVTVTDLIGYNRPIDNFNINTAYLKNQAARFNGSTFRARENTQGNPLPVAPAVQNQWWNLEAQRGVDGDGAVSAVAGILPGADGDVILTPQDIGALGPEHLRDPVHRHVEVVDTPVTDYDGRGIIFQQVGATLDTPDRPSYDEVLESVEENKELLIKSTGVNIWEFVDLIPNKDTASNENEWDWTLAFRAAIAKAYTTGLSIVLVPFYGDGRYFTNPISFEGYESLTILGVGGNHAWGGINRKSVSIIFNVEGDVGFQFSDTNNPDPRWNAPHCKLENLAISGASKVRTCVNGNYNLTIKDCRISGAIEDGVTFEDVTYPALIDGCDILYNGRHGLYVKGPRTTIYTINRSNFQENRGYGICIEAGAGAKLSDVTLHSNYVGGIKFNRRNDLYNALQYYWFENIIMDNVYTEQNGKLTSSDANYEGNYSLFITKTGVAGQVPSNPTSEVRSLTINGGAVYASANGNTYKIDAVYGLRFNNVATDHTKSTVNNPLSLGLEITSSTTFVGADAREPFINSYFGKGYDDMPFKYIKGAIMSQRGRLRTITFVAPDINAGQSVIMSPAEFLAIEGIRKGVYINDSKASLVSIEVSKRHWNQSSIGTPRPSGTLTAEIVTTASENGSTPSNLYAGTNVSLNLANSNFAERKFNPFEKSISGGIRLLYGVRLTASSDYMKSENEPSDLPVVVTLVVEY